MKHWLESGKYMSHEIVNEIMRLMARHMLNEILNEIREVSVYSLIADEASDVAHKKANKCVI